MTSFRQLIGAASLLLIGCVGDTDVLSQGEIDASSVSNPDADQSSPDIDAAVDAAPADYNWMDHLQFHTISPTGGNCNEGTYGKHYCDVMGHTKNPYLASDTLTNVHETLHFMLHEHGGATPENDKFIYWREGKGAFFMEPTITTKDIVEYIADEYTTYNTYIQSRPNQVLGENIVDEWCAYLTEEITAIEMAHIQGKTSGVDGLVVAGIEFMYYNAAALHALAQKEPDYLANNPQSLAIFAMLAEGVKEWTIDQGVEVGIFTSWANERAEKQLEDFRTKPANEPIRQTLRDLYGQAWTSRVMGF